MSHYDKVNFAKIVKESNNLSDICRNLGIVNTSGNRNTIKKYIEEYGLNTDHFKIVSKPGLKRELSEILVENSTYNHTSNLKNRLYKEGLKERTCEMEGCGQGEMWLGKKISLILDHINGVNDDNRLENLRIVCPNCNATLDTHCGRNIHKKYKHFVEKSGIVLEKKIKKCGCGEIIDNRAKICKKCYSIKARKVKNRPNLETLLEDVANLGYVGTGKKYGVSDNSIRKWIKKYEKNV